MKEQQIQKKILQKLTKEGAYVIKVISATKRGVPDIVACYEGFFIGIEVKTEKGKLTPLQQKNLDEIYNANGISFTCYGFKDFENKFKYMKNLVKDKLCYLNCLNYQ